MLQEISKRIINQTNIGDDRYPVYRHRSPQDGGKIHTSHNSNASQTWNNSWVVPYNPWLLKKYNAHINVEWCASIKAIKYLYNYMFKGHDRVIIQLDADPEGSRPDSTQFQKRDEIADNLNCRYVGSQEACWRIFGFELHQRFPAVVPLDVHLQDQQAVYFQSGRAEERANIGPPTPN